MSHYDGGEFEKMLQEAEANMLRGIPSMEVPREGGIISSPAAVPGSVGEERVEKPKPSAVQTQGRSDVILHFLLTCTFNLVICCTFTQFAIPFRRPFFIY